MLRHFGRYLRTAARVSRTRYPGFILGLPLDRDEIPVFTYHDVAAEELRADLDYLYVNGYRTLGLQEYLGTRAARNRSLTPIRRPRVQPPSPGKSWTGRGDRRAVMLTFDDARKSFWHTVLPLLREFSAHAVLFAPTYWMDSPAGRQEGEIRPPRACANPADDLFMSWTQLKVCAESGHVDVQSHAHRHTLVAVAPTQVDFANPQALARFDLYDWPMRWMDGRDELGQPALGTPVYRAAPLLSAQRRYLENSAVTQACRDLVERGGGTHFFSRPGWRGELQALHGKCSRRQPGAYMPAEAFRQLLASEFEYSRDAFKSHLGYAPTCLAYPWMLGSRQSLELARQFGLQAAFGVALDYRAERDRSLPIPVYGRLKCDWLRFMPGRQRRSAIAAVGKKISGLAGIQHLAH